MEVVACCWNNVWTSIKFLARFHLAVDLAARDLNRYTGHACVGMRKPIRNTLNTSWQDFGFVQFVQSVTLLQTYTCTESLVKIYRVDRAACIRLRASPLERIRALLGSPYLPNYGSITGDFLKLYGSFTVSQCRWF